MATSRRDGRALWLVLGLVAGLGLAWVWPHEPMQASTGDRDGGKFGMCCMPANFTDSSEAVMVLDFLTGRLYAAAINPKIGKFTNFWMRNLAADFDIDPKADPHYAMVSGHGQLVASGGIQWTQGLLYVGEMTSGKVACYAFPFRESTRPLPVITPQPIDIFQFREAAAKQ